MASVAEPTREQIIAAMAGGVSRLFNTPKDVEESDTTACVRVIPPFAGAYNYGQIQTFQQWIMSNCKNVPNATVTTQALGTLKRVGDHLLSMKDTITLISSALHIDLILGPIVDLPINVDDTDPEPLTRSMFEIALLPCMLAFFKPLAAEACLSDELPKTFAAIQGFMEKYAPEEDCCIPYTPAIELFQYWNLVPDEYLTKFVTTYVNVKQREDHYVKQVAEAEVAKALVDKAKAGPAGPAKAKAKK